MFLVTFEAYPAPGAPQLARRVKELLQASGFSHVDEDRTRGLDHGAWVPLMLMYPEADIPVCQLSLSSNKDVTYHYNLEDGSVLIMGSGSATHNLSTMKPPGSPVPSRASEFDTWFKDTLLDGRYGDINHYEEKAPHARKAHPWPDHLFPLPAAIGAAGETHPL